jgi:hypothetical protein
MSPKHVRGRQMMIGATKGIWFCRRCQPAGQDPEARLARGTVAVPLCSRPNASPFWIMLLLVSGRLDNGMIRIWQPDTGVA